MYRTLRQELFRCDVDCVNHPDHCISERWPDRFHTAGQAIADDARPQCCRLYKQQAEALQTFGFVDAGYTGIHMDGMRDMLIEVRLSLGKGQTDADCWESKAPARNTTSGELLPDATRFPSGLKQLGDYIHSVGASFGLYTAESPLTCGGYPASADHEALDARTFAAWGVDYIKGDELNHAFCRRCTCRSVASVGSPKRFISHGCSGRLR